jgi:hypothetical protein
MKVDCHCGSCFRMLALCSLGCPECWQESLHGTMTLKQDSIVKKFWLNTEFKNCCIINYCDIVSHHLQQEMNLSERS